MTIREIIRHPNRICRRLFGSARQLAKNVIIRIPDPGRAERKRRSTARSEAHHLAALLLRYQQVAAVVDGHSDRAVEVGDPTSRIQRIGRIGLPLWLS